MQKWEYMIIVQAWNNIEQKFYWGDDMTDERNPTDRLNALGQEGWELVSTFSSGRPSEYYNFVLKRPVE